MESDVEIVEVGLENRFEPLDVIRFVLQPNGVFPKGYRDDTLFLIDNGSYERATQVMTDEDIEYDLCDRMDYDELLEKSDVVLYEWTA